MARSAYTSNARDSPIMVLTLMSATRPMVRPEDLGSPMRTSLTKIKRKENLPKTQLQCTPKRTPLVCDR